MPSAVESHPEVAFTSRNSSIPHTPPSRALPEAFTPPNGDPAPRDLPFISTIPARNWRARRLRRAPSCDWTSLVRPWGVSLAIRTASSSVSKGMIDRTGPSTGGNLG